MQPSALCTEAESIMSRQWTYSLTLVCCLTLLGACGSDATGATSDTDQTAADPGASTGDDTTGDTTDDATDDSTPPAKDSGPAVRHDAGSVTTKPTPAVTPTAKDSSTPAHTTNTADAGVHVVADAGTPGPMSTASGAYVFPPVKTFTDDGTFIPMTEAGGPSCTIYRPATLGEQGRKHPVVVWGNGTFNTPDSYDAFFKHLASQGFIIAAANTSDSGSGMEMLACLEWVLAQNTASGPYKANVDEAHIISSGYSQGGCGCLMAGRDPRFIATAAVSPYIVLPLGGCDAGSVKQQIHPMFMLSGGTDTVAVPADNQAPIFADAPVPIAWATYAPAGHLEILGAGGAHAGPLTAWYRYKLMNDPMAATYFEKSDPGIAKLSGWSIMFNAKWTD